MQTTPTIKPSPQIDSYFSGSRQPLITPTANLRPNPEIYDPIASSITAISPKSIRGRFVAP